jgi:uncharacterized ubiquitin-like protein YukD
MSSKEAFFVNSQGPDDNSAKKAFQWLLKRPEKNAFLAVPVYGTLKGVISNVLGNEAVKLLKKSGVLRLGNKDVVLVTERKHIYDGKNLPLLAFYPTRGFLDKLDSIPNVSAMLVVPWIMKKVEPWIRTWNAMELEAQGSMEAPEELVSNKVVVQALKSLTATVNVSTGITHPLDKEAAIQTFTILRNAGELFNPVDVKAWLIRYGNWDATDAQEVADIAQKVLERRRLRKGRSHWRKDILKIWREEAAKSA